MRFKSLSVLLFIFAIAFYSSAKEKERNQDFNFGWKFALNDKQSFSQEKFNDNNWRDVNLPHDWSVEFSFDTLQAEGCTGYLKGGIGWYRKYFTVSNSSDENVYVLFDGVYNHSEVWINGKKLGYHPYGYTPFYYNLTPYLNKSGEDNVIAVKVDHSRFADSRWYTGSGIYRNVKLVTTNKLHIPIWGTFVTTPKVSKDQAQVSIAITVENDFDKKKEFSATTEIFNTKGKYVLKAESKELAKASGKISLKHNIKVENPQLWSVDTPNLYKAVTTLRVGKKVIDSYVSTFGIRSIRFDVNKGFFLNEVNMKIKGVCLHHDGGLVGSAVPKGVWKRRLEILKAGGCNAIRISHNPASDELLELCDEMGILVQDEFFDEWDYPKDKRLNMNERHDDYITRGSAEYFQEWAEKDLKTTVLAHRNHPSVFQWSIGNEIEWTYPRNKKAAGFWDADWSGNYFWSPTPLSPKEIKSRYDSMPALEHNIGETAQKLSRWTKEMDTSRPVIANCILPSASYVTGYADALDIIGFSYRRVMYDYGHENFPKKPIMGTENLGQWHDWKAIQERPFISGTFLWTGIDYMGEAHHRESKKPQARRKGTASGLLDYAGFEKPSYYMMKSLWSDDATLYISTQKLGKSIYKIDQSTGKVVEKKPGAWEKALWVWHDVNDHWNYKKGEQTIVEIISNCPEVELSLNGKSLGRKKLADFEDHIYKWAVPFAIGKLEAKSVFNGTKISTKLTTASKPTSIKLTVDKTELNADGYEIAHVIAQLLDQAGNPVVDKDKSITFDVEGNVKVMGVDNGSNKNFQNFHSNKLITYKGRALLIVQSTTQKGKAMITATAGDIESNKIKLGVK